MATGRGISRYIGKNPKCTVNIENIIKVLNGAGITEIAIVLGNRDEIIE